MYSYLYTHVYTGLFILFDLFWIFFSVSLTNLSGYFSFFWQFSFSITKITELCDRVHVTQNLNCTAAGLRKFLPRRRDGIHVQISRTNSSSTRGGTPARAAAAAAAVDATSI